MYHLNEMTAEMDDMDHLIEDETSQREWHLEENILQWFTAFAKAALDQTPGTPNPDDIEDTAHDVAEFTPEALKLERLMCAKKAGSAWARIRNGSKEILHSQAITNAARSFGRLRLG